MRKTRWLASTMLGFLEIVGLWQRERAGTLHDLDQLIQVYYQEKLQELADLYPKKRGGDKREVQGGAADSCLRADVAA